MAAILAGAVVTADMVREVYDTALTDARLANFINMAYLSSKDLGITDADVLQHVQLLLAAHFATVYDRVVASQGVAGEYNVSYAQVIGEGLKSSVYGQQAIALDPTGKLAKAGSKRVGFSVTSEYQLYDTTYLDILPSA